MTCDRCGHDDWTLQREEYPDRHNPPVTQGTWCNHCGLFVDKWGEVDWDVPDDRDPLQRLVDYAENGVSLEGPNELIDDAARFIQKDTWPTLRRLRREVASK